ncbi:MAG: L-seryl-tRNA(Sec) selenium transferase, partial [Gemmatimonadales bacterium]
MTDPRRALPSVSGLLEREDVMALMAEHPRSLVVDAVRRAVEDVRKSSIGEDEIQWGDHITAHVRAAARRSLRPVYNATGVVLHTNLGRAPLAQVAIDAVREAAEGYTNLEYDLETGERGSRYVHCVRLLRELTGA